ncbi:MAG: hypothetical protein PHI90_04385 [Clostridia bacterium]|nr:hypothetical protein [Clostridia bacterium]MDD4048049.1 hypothetical protein [Clostridia bacterium]
MKKKSLLLISILNLKKSKYKWIGIIILLFGLLYGGSYVYEELTRLPPKEAVKIGTENTIRANNYRFRVVSSRVLEGEEVVLSDVYGDRCSRGIHLKGTLPLIQADVEIYHIGENIYRKDSCSENWVKVPARGRVAIEQLIAELNPLESFNFLDNKFEAKYVGKEKVDGRKCYKYEVMTRGENKYLELFWRSFNYIIWIDKNDNLIRKASVIAEHLDNSQHCLNIVVSITDYEELIEIKAPIE